MTEKIIGIFGQGVPQPGEVDDQALQLVLEVLKRVKSGATVGVTIVESASLNKETQWCSGGWVHYRSVLGCLAEIGYRYAKKVE